MFENILYLYSDQKIHYMNGQSAAKSLSSHEYEKGSTTIKTTFYKDKGVEYTSNSGKGRNLHTTFIYALLENNTNNIRYIGKANNVQQRFKFHLLDKEKTHKTCWLKSIDYNISYIILDEVDKSEWQFWEIYWINQCKVWGFNLTNQTLGGEGSLGKKLSEKHKQKISIKLKGKIVSSETKQKLSKSIKGKKLSETHIRNLSKSHKGLIYPKGNYGKHCKRKIGQYKEGILIKVWDSLKDASEFYKVHYASISHCCAGRKKQIKGYIWKYVD